MVFGLSAFRMKQLVFPLARWGAAAGSIGVFLLYEEFPQLILQTQYGVFPGYKDVLVAFGLMTQKRANSLDKALPASPGALNRPYKEPVLEEDVEAQAQELLSTAPTDA